MPIECSEQTSACPFTQTVSVYRGAVATGIQILEEGLLDDAHNSLLHMEVVKRIYPRRFSKLSWKTFASFVASKFIKLLCAPSRFFS